MKITARACRASGRTGRLPACCLVRGGGARLPASFAKLGRGKTKKRKLFVCLTRRPPSRCVTASVVSRAGFLPRPLPSLPPPPQQPRRPHRARWAPPPRPARTPRAGPPRRRPSFRFSRIPRPSRSHRRPASNAARPGWSQPRESIASPTSEHDRSARAPACAQPLSARASTSDRAREDCRQT